MRKSRFSETQILNILKAVESGQTVSDVCRENGISDATFYNWRAKYGLEVFIVPETSCPPLSCLNHIVQPFKQSIREAPFPIIEDICKVLFKCLSKINHRFKARVRKPRTVFLKSSLCLLYSIGSSINLLKDKPHMICLGSFQVQLPKVVYHDLLAE